MFQSQASASLKKFYFKTRNSSQLHHAKGQCILDTVEFGTKTDFLNDN